jgi:membrane peptidoglycan carboxypeptidase
MAERRVFSEETSWLVMDMLADPEARRPCCGMELPFDLPFRVAAKTGTARGFADTWAVAATEQPVAVPAGATPGAATVAATETAPAPVPALPPAAAEMESRTVVENGHLRAEFSNRGAQLVSFRTRGPGVNEPGGLELVRERGRDAYPFALVGATDADSAAVRGAILVLEGAVTAGRMPPRAALEALAHMCFGMGRESR